MTKLKSIQHQHKTNIKPNQHQLKTHIKSAPTPNKTQHQRQNKASQNKSTPNIADIKSK